MYFIQQILFGIILRFMHFYYIDNINNREIITLKYAMQMECEGTV